MDGKYKFEFKTSFIGWLTVIKWVENNRLIELEEKKGWEVGSGL